MPITRPVLTMPIVTATARDHERLMEALAKISSMDASIVVRSDADSDEILISGTSSQHLQSIFRKIADDHSIPVLPGVLRVRYLETIRASSEAEARYIRQIGGKGNYAQVLLRLVPGNRGAGIAFDDTSPSGAIPERFMKSIEQGVREAAQVGILAGHEMTDLRATLIGGSVHDTDSNHAAFQIAASIAFKDAAKKARPVVLEPIMSVQFTIPDRQRDQLLREIRARRGRTVSMDHKDGSLVVRATVPLRGMLDFNRLGAPTMHLAGYEQTSWPFDSGSEEIGTPVRRPTDPSPQNRSSTANPESEDPCI
jgi:elongation factor G